MRPGIGANDVSTVYTVYDMFGYHMKIDEN